MSSNWDDIRKYRRVFFPAKESIDMTIGLPDIESRITGKILDLSGGGMGCVIKRHPNLTFKKGDSLDLLEIKNDNGLHIQAPMKIEIRWVMAPERFSNIGLGCQFINFPEDVASQILTFVEDTLNKLDWNQQIRDSMEYIKKGMSTRGDAGLR